MVKKIVLAAAMLLILSLGVSTIQAQAVEDDGSLTFPPGCTVTKHLRDVTGVTHEVFCPANAEIPTESGRDLVYENIVFFDPVLFDTEEPFSYDSLEVGLAHTIVMAQDTCIHEQSDGVYVALWQVEPGTADIWLGFGWLQFEDLAGASIFIPNCE